MRARTGSWALAAFVAVLAVGCGDDRITFPVGNSSVDGDRVAVHGDWRTGRRLDVEERADTVVLRLTAEADDGGDCFDCVIVTLDDALGDRTLVDGPSGAVVPITDQLEPCFTDEELAPADP